MNSYSSIIFEGTDTILGLEDRYPLREFTVLLGILGRAKAMYYIVTYLLKAETRCRAMVQ
jgi:hypothetical protein